MCCSVRPGWAVLSVWVDSVGSDRGPGECAPDRGNCQSCPMRLSPGRFLARVTALPAIAVSAWLLVTFPLLALGTFTPVWAVTLGAPAVTTSCVPFSSLVPDPTAEEAHWR